MLQQWHQGGPHAPIGCFVSTNQTRGSVWILQIFAWGTWLVKEACGGQPLHHIPFSAIPPPIRPHPHPTQPKKIRSNKVMKRSSEGTTNHLSQSIQWTGRSGAWHLYAIIHAIRLCSAVTECGHFDAAVSQVMECMPQYMWFSIAAPSQQALVSDAHSKCFTCFHFCWETVFFFLLPVLVKVIGWLFFQSINYSPASLISTFHALRSPKHSRSPPTTSNQVFFLS